MAFHHAPSAKIWEEGKGGHEKLKIESKPPKKIESENLKKMKAKNESRHIWESTVTTTAFHHAPSAWIWEDGINMETVLNKSDLNKAILLSWSFRSSELSSIAL
jgi:hypothetical protein